MIIHLLKPAIPTRVPAGPAALSIALHAAVTAALISLAPLLETNKPELHKDVTVVPLIAPRDLSRHEPEPRVRQPRKTLANRTYSFSALSEAPQVAQVLTGTLDPTTPTRVARAKSVDIVIGRLNGVPVAAGGTAPVGAVGITDLFTPSARQQPSPGSAVIPSTRARLLSAPSPSYPEEAKQLGITGNVVLEVELLASGSVRVLRVLTALGHGLDEAAVDAVNGTRCIPASLAGQPVTVNATISVVFKLT